MEFFYGGYGVVEDWSTVSMVDKNGLKEGKMRCMRERTREERIREGRVVVRCVLCYDEP